MSASLTSQISSESVESVEATEPLPFQSVIRVDMPCSVRLSAELDARSRVSGMRESNEWSCYTY
jgi:hypothetical protein